MNKKILFVDTNGFLQLRDLKDIGWRELFPDVNAVDVMVAPRVIEELDKHKTSTNKRRRNRARLALELIEKASSEPDFALVIREDPVQIRIVISNAPRFDWDKHPTLDPLKPDDQLVAEALSFSGGAELFTHDTGPRIRARVAGIQAHAPREGWLLPAEQTDDQRKIASLEHDLQEARSRYPKIMAGFQNLDPLTGEIELVRPIVPPLNPEVVQRLASEYLCRYPLETISRMSVGGFAFDGISQHQIDEYHADHSAFQRSVREYFENLHERVKSVGAASPSVEYLVRNESGIAAAGLRVEFQLEGPASLLADREDAAPYIGALKMPKPPDKPRSSLDPSFIRNIPTFSDAMKPRDPIAFYWYERPNIPSHHSAQQCENFRPKREFRDRIFVFSPVEFSDEISIQLHVSAANLPDPIEQSAKLRISNQSVDWLDPVVQMMLPQWVRSRFST